MHWIMTAKTMTARPPAASRVELEACSFQGDEAAERVAIRQKTGLAEKRAPKSKGGTTVIVKPGEWRTNQRDTHERALVFTPT